MRILITILSFIFIQTLTAQNNVAELKSFLETLEKTDSIKQKIKEAHFQNLEILDLYIELERKIDFGYMQYRILVMPISGWDLKLNFISKDGIIKYGLISEYKYNEEKHLNIKNFSRSPDILRQYTSKHNKYYDTNLDQPDFIEQLLKEYVVGFGCGFSGKQISKESKKSIRYAKKRNFKKLNELLTSFSPELQTLGVIGILKIGKITDLQKKIIQHLKKRNSVIYSCSGCLYGIGETFNKRIKYYEQKASR
ncbi:hypothetical protein [Zunongwangia sp.]|uniref:hypothetical protein n=1 Tax=Zunongwangia sp. TaxID=1965325 RepID=UPI003AA8C27C